MKLFGDLPLSDATHCDPRAKEIPDNSVSTSPPELKCLKADEDEGHARSKLTATLKKEMCIGLPLLFH